MNNFLILAAFAVSVPFAQLDTKPAARQHVKIVGVNAIKFTSKLTSIVDLNFTMGNGHQPGKIAVTATLARVAKAYGIGGVDAFTITHFTSALDGSKAGEVPNFSIDDLLKGDVIVADNISHFADPIMGVPRQQALQRAIEVEGKGYLGIHGSGDNKASTWPWYTNTLHPVNYDGHGSREPGPIYREPKSVDHMVLAGMYKTKTVLATVPNGVDATGRAILTDGIATRSMTNEWYRNGRDLSNDPAFKDKITPLLKYDPRALGTDALPVQYKRAGGNLYTWLYKIGNGMTSYLPAGHDAGELVGPASFDGGSGDLDLYFGQMLFFLAGYKQQVCDASCNGLPIVDELNRLTGKVYNNGTLSIANSLFNGKSGVFIDPKIPAFQLSTRGVYNVSLMDSKGHIHGKFVGTGEFQYTWQMNSLRPGVYFLRIKIGKAAPKIQRYFIAPAFH